MSYYHGLISSRTASIRLEKASKDGSFLIRDSQSQPGNFVLSVRYRKNVYHILIFNKTDEYYLDSSENDKKEVDKFSSLEDLVLFGMSHELRVVDQEVMLYEPVLCTDGISMQVSVPMNGQKKKQEENEDSDLLTDMFASVFGTQCSVLVMVHSDLNLDGQPRDGPESYLGCLVKDNLLRGFYIRVVNPQTREMIGEKKVTKNFEYDLPSDLVLTFLSELGITCIGFRNSEEKIIFTRHIDRIVQMQQDKKVNVNKHPSSSPERDPLLPEPEQSRQSLKAEEFDINNVSAEWQYIFEQAGVTEELLKNKKVLQFLLDKIQDLGGAPTKIDDKQKYNSNKEERTAAIQMDATLRQESLRASILADELHKTTTSMNIVPQPVPRKFIPPSCSYSGVCTRYKELLMQRSSLTGLSPVKIRCYCNLCAAGKPLLAVSGSPPHQYTLPVGWCQFILRSQTHSLSQQFCSNWHVAFCPVPASYVATVVRTGRLMHSASGGTVMLSPDVKWAKSTGSITPELYHDEVERKDFKISTIFQVFIQPGSYKIEKQDLTSLQPLQQVWQAPEKTYIPYALLLQLHPMTK